MNIVLFDPAEINSSQATLPRRDSRSVHLLKVLHKGIGDTFEAGVLGGKKGKGSIEAFRADGSLVCSLNLDRNPPPRAPLTIAVGFPRQIQLRRILRDLSNLGVRTIVLFGSDLGEKSYRDTKLLEDGGAQSALIEGAVQARDTMLPGLEVYASLDEWLSHLFKQEERKPLLIAADNVNPHGSFAGITPGLEQHLAIGVGSERGWSERERALLELKGFQRLSMGSRALRSETACIAATVLALEKIGDFG
jgi:RsmE family RNA methyltransferase